MGCSQLHLAGAAGTVTHRRMVPDDLAFCHQTPEGTAAAREGQCGAWGAVRLHPTHSGITGSALPLGRPREVWLHISGPRVAGETQLSTHVVVFAMLSTQVNLTWAEPRAVVQAQGTCVLGRWQGQHGFLGPKRARSRIQNQVPPVLGLSREAAWGSTALACGGVQWLVEALEGTGQGPRTQRAGLPCSRVHLHA